MRLVNFQYAKAFIQAVSDKKISDSIYNETREMVLPTLELAELKDIFQNPAILCGTKLSILEQLFRGSINEYWFNFFSLVIRKGRGSMFINILKSFLLQYEEIKGIKKARIITASNVADVSLKLLKNIASKMAACNELVVENIIDPTIIGGYIILVEDNQLDCSLKNHLRQVQAKLIA